MLYRAWRLVVDEGIPIDERVDFGVILYWWIYEADSEQREAVCHDGLKAAEESIQTIDSRESCAATPNVVDEACLDNSEGATVTNSEPEPRRTRRPRKLLTKSLSLPKLSQLLSPCRTPLKSLRERRIRAEAAASASTPSSPNTGRESFRTRSPLWGRPRVMMESAPQDPPARQEGEDTSREEEVVVASSEAMEGGAGEAGGGGLQRGGGEGAEEDFVRKIPEGELAKIEAFRAALRDAGIVLTPSYMAANFHEPEHSLLHRFLVARDHNIERAMRMLEGDIRWREGWGDGAGMLAWHAQSLEEVVGMPEDEYEQHYWSRFLTYDQDDGGCPVFYRCLTGMRTWELLKHTTVPRVVQHLLWEFEKHSAALFHHPPTFPCRQLKYLISIKDMDWPQLTSDLLAILGGFSDVSKLHHPERLKQLYIVHAPWAFGVAWSLLTPFIPPKTREKVCILNCSQTDSHPVVSKWLRHLRPPARP